MKIFISLTLAGLFLLSSVFADIRVDINNGKGGNSSFSSNGKVVRMDDADQPGYMLIDLKTSQFKMVDTTSREVIDMSGMMPPMSGAMPPSVPAVTINLKNTGSGPDIAGYPTQRYLVIANGTNCGTIFGSKKALQEKGMQSLLDAMKQLSQQANKMSRQFRTMRSVCEQADFENASTFQKTGAPMRIVDENGQIDSEVSKIDSNAQHPAGHYDTPKGFRVTSMQGKMNQAMQQNQRMQRQMPQGMPDMNQIMQQMQQGGGMPPEAMERIKQMQQMFKQQYPQQ